MRIILLIILAIASQVAAAQKTDTLVKYLDKDLAFTTKASVVYPAIGFPQNGHWILKSFYPDTTLAVEVSFLDKKMTINDGGFVINYNQGMPALRGNYRNNYRNGVWKSWYQNGQLKDSGALVNDVLVGTWLTYFPNGTLMTRANFSQQVESSGLAPLVSTVDKNSLLNFPPTIAIKSGLLENWYRDGKKQDSGSFVNDVKIGYWRSWYETGNLESEGRFGPDENREGDWTFYREDGSISTREQYVNNKLNDLKCYDEKSVLTGSSCSIAKPPVLLGTPYDWKEFFESRLVWSKEALKRSEGGVITIKFTISKDGKLADHSILNSTSKESTLDIEKVLSLMTDWSPAILHNRPLQYSFDYELPFYPR